MISIRDVQQARETVQQHIKDTPLEHSQSCSELLGCEAYLKFENLQTSGSFKIRGAVNKISSLTKSERQRGVVASSAGNHAQGVAIGARSVGVSAKIVMPINAPLVKVEATRHYGAQVVLHGNYYDEAFQKAQEIEKKEKRVFVHPYNDPHVIAGQGTIGLEIIEKIKDLNSILVPIGGGGLISGIAIAVKAHNPKCKVIGAVAAGAPAMYDSFKKGKIINYDKTVSTIADGVAIKKVMPEMFNGYITKLVDDMYVCTDDEIAESIVYLMERAKTVTEGAGALGMAAARKVPKKLLGKKSCIVLCGGNIDMNIIAKVIERGMAKNGRITRIQVAVPDKPGVLRDLTKIIADARANIMQVDHDRTLEGLYLGETSIEFLLETNGWDHVHSIQKQLQTIGRIISPLT